jgi:hypothetical protein
LGSLQTISAAEPIALGSPIDRFGVALQMKCGLDRIASQTPFVLRNLQVEWTLPGSGAD